MISATTVTKLQKLQNKCVKLITGQGATMNKFASLKILKIQDLIELGNCKFGYKLLHYQIPEQILELSQSDHSGKNLQKTHKYDTRHKSLLNKPKAQNKLYRSCIVYKGTDSLNSIKLETRNMPNLHLLVAAYKKLIFEKYQK